MSLSQRSLVSKTITVAIANDVVGGISQLYAMKSLVVEANFVYGADGTTTKVWIQTSVDGGFNWIDIINFAFTTSSGRKVSTVDVDASATAVVPTDAGLADNAIVDGILGDRLRAKVTTTGTYSGGTTLNVTMVPKAG